MPGLALLSVVGNGVVDDERPSASARSCTELKPRRVSHDTNPHPIGQPFRCNLPINEFRLMCHQASIFLVFVLLIHL